MTLVHLFAIKGRRKRGFQFFKIVLETRLASAKWKEVYGKSDKINELILKTKVDEQERLDNIIYLLIDEGGRETGGFV